MKKLFEKDVFFLLKTINSCKKLRIAFIIAYHNIRITCFVLGFNNNSLFHANSVHYYRNLIKSTSICFYVEDKALSNNKEF